MGTAMFDQFKQILKLALQDTDFRRKNTIFQDSTYLQNALARVDSLTPDISITQGYSDVISVLGMMTQDTSTGVMRFNTQGFTTTLSAYREGITSEPRRIFRRATVTDGVYYLMADGGIGATGTGVFLLNSSLSVLRRFPHFGDNIAGGDYQDPATAITFSIATTEYVAIADATHHVVQIYLYAAPYTHIATIGTVDTPGAAVDLLTAPNGIAVDETNSLMYISCPTGQPAGATASNGFVAVYDLTVIGTPAFDSIPLYYAGTGSLLDTQVYTPVDLVYDGTLLWISNSGTDTVGAFDVSTATPICTRFIESAGQSYTLRNPQQIYFRSLPGGFARLYVVNSDTGTIEEFDALTYQHLETYGIRATEDSIPANYTRMSPDVFGALGQPYGVVVDNITLNGKSTNVLIVTDGGNKRIHRFNLDAYTATNYVNFSLMDFDVPISVRGWSISGTVPPDMIHVFYRFAETEDFRELSQYSTNVPATTSVQFRLAIVLDSRRFVRDWYVNELIIYGQQA